MTPFHQKCISALFAVLIFVVMGLLLVFLILYIRRWLFPDTSYDLIINDGEAQEVIGGVSLLDTLSHMGIPIPASCGGKASCKQCRIRITSQAAPPLSPDKNVFSVQELDEGWRLACQYKIRQSISIHVDSQYLNAKHFSCTVVSNQCIASFMKELVVELPSHDVCPYVPGQYLIFQIPRYTTHTDEWNISPRFLPLWKQLSLMDKTLQNDTPVERSYSFASYPAESPLLKFIIRIAPPPSAQESWGIGSSYLFSLRPGDVVSFKGPYGNSIMHPSTLPLFFLIGGAGASFSRSHILHLFHTEASSREIHLWYGARSLQDNVYQQEYTQLAQHYPQFHYHVALSSPTEEDRAQGWDIHDPIKTNLLYKAFELGHLKTMQTPWDAWYYVCGPHLHNTSILQLLENYHVPKTQIVLDDFG